MKVLGSTFLTYRQNFVLYTHPYNIVYFIHHSTKCSPKSLEKTVQGTRQGKRALTKAVYNHRKQRYELIKSNVTRLS